MKNFSVVLSALFILFSGCKKTEANYYHTQGEIFKTYYSIKYKYNRLLEKEIGERLNEFDLSLNPFNKSSIIYKVNNNIDVETDDWFKTVFLKAAEISTISDGSYDITAAPLINLWGFGYDKIEEPTPQVIDSLKEFTGYQKIRLEGNKVIKDDPRVQLNASSIAKGFACDVIAGLLDSYHIGDYMIEIGGEVRAKGKNPKNVCWRIQIDKPVDDPVGNIHEQMEVVELCDKSLATSGNYRNFYVKDGKKYAHTIDPISGYPAQSNILSATVLYADCMTADAFATAFMTMDVEKAVSIAKQIPNLEYLFIYTDEENGEYKTIENIHR